MEAYMDMGLDGISIYSETQNLIELLDPLKCKFTCD